MSGHQSEETQGAKASGKLSWCTKLWLIPLVIVVIVLLPLLLLGFALWHCALLLSIWTIWCRKGRSVLFVYSDSLNWQKYVTENYLPKFDERTAVLNWSERAKWKHSLAAFAFKHWGGRRSCNPLGVVFRPLEKTRVFRFYQPFLDLKHGKPEALKKLESEFFTCVESTRTACSIQDAQPLS